jgi:S-adenosylmethionine hydrolase
MKGAIARINPTLTVIDLTHQIPPQNLAAARFCLTNAYPYFPKGTVHVAVVDPGVGSRRRAIAIKLTNGFFVGPDNGIVSGVIETLEEKVVSAVALTNRNYWRTPEPSTTFHGRDIFAPAGACLASGVAIEELGEAIDPASLVALPLSAASREQGGIEGCIQYIDGFGNLITNIPGGEVRGKNWRAIAAGKNIPGGNTYADTLPGELISLVGSHGWVEIAANCGSAESKLKLEWGARVRVSFV